MGELDVRLHSTLCAFEKGLNIAGYVPLVSCISGAVRGMYGKIEIIAGVVAASFLAIAAFFNPNADVSRQWVRKAVDILTTYSLHGIANIGRSWIEMIPLLSLVTCLPYDLMGKRFAYPQERAGHWEFVPEARPVPQGA